MRTAYYRLRALSRKGQPFTMACGSLVYLLRLAKQFDASKRPQNLKGRRWIDLNFEPAVLVREQRTVTVLRPHERDRLMKVLCVTVGLLLCASFAQAQQAPIATYQVTFYNVGAAQPLQAPASIPAANFICNQTPVPVVPPVVNPRVIEFDDPANAGKACVYTDPGNATGVLFSVPLQSAAIESTVNAITTTNVASGESARSNSFTHPGDAPAVRTGYKAAK